MKNTRIAVIRLRGDLGLKKGFIDTFKLLKLYKKNNCIVISNKPEYIGMLTKVQDSITWGEIDTETLKLLLSKRGRLAGNKLLSEDYLMQKLNVDLNTFVKDYMEFKREIKDIPGLKIFFRLNPPRHGFESKGIKFPYSLGGATGYRKNVINDLIKRML